MATLRQSQTFSAKRPDGTPVTLFVFSRSSDSSMVDAFNQDPTERSIRTQKGQVVDYLAPGRYRVRDGGELLLSDDPAAP